MDLKMLQPLLSRPPTPGEIWTFNSFEAHCFREFLEDAVLEALLAGTSVSNWDETLRLEASKAELRRMSPDKLAELGMSSWEKDTVTQVTPTEEDRAFFEKLASYVLILLANIEPAKKLPCGTTIYEHEVAVRAWQEREIERPKSFAKTRAALKLLPVEKALNGKPKLARADADKLIAEELERLRIWLHAGDFVSCEGLPVEELPDVREGLALAHRATLAEAQKDLRALLGEKYELI